MCKLLVDENTPCLWHHHAGLFCDFVGAIEFAQVTGDGLIDFTQSPLKFLACKAPRLGVYGLELATVDGDDGRIEQVNIATQCDELCDELFANLANGGTIVPAEIGDRLEIWLETSRQPHELKIACALALQPTR